MSTESIEFQVRSEETGLKFFMSFVEAYNYCHSSNSAWKLSFVDDDGAHRWVIYSAAEIEMNTDSVIPSTFVVPDGYPGIIWADCPMDQAYHDTVISELKKVLN